jgi:predicted DNA-binding transcriptional regulator YafY
LEIVIMTSIDQLDGSGLPDEFRRVARVLEIIQYIATRPGWWRRKSLAERYELSERQIQKDLDIIRHRLGLALVHDGKGYSFERIPQLPTVAYTFSEALALLMAFQAAQQVSGIGSPDLAAAIARLQSVFPLEFAPLFGQITSQAARSGTRTQRQQTLLLLNRALIEQRKARLVYRTQSRGGELNERVVRPYHIMPYVRSWQLIAYCERRQAVLMFKVDRIQAITLLDERYAIPKDFALDDYMGATWGLLRGDASEPVDIVLHFSPEAGAWVAEEQWHPSQQVEEQADGSVLFKLYIAVTAEFVNWLMYYGSRVHVLEPVWLRERVRDEHQAAADIDHHTAEATESGGAMKC